MRRAVVLMLLAAAGAGVYALVPPAPRTLAAPPEAIAVPPRGAVHVHTRRSDGSGTVDDVAAEAARAGLRFVIVTDHGDATRRPEPPSYRHGVLVLDGVEVSTWGGHVLAIGMPQAPYPLNGEPRDVLDDIARLGGFSVAAHPVNEKPESQWTGWDAPFDALEWINGDSEWRDEAPYQLARMAVTYAFRQAESLALMLDRDDEAMRRWDALTQRRRVVALAGSDAHARIGWAGAPEPFAGRARIRVPGYESMFRTFSIALPEATLTGHAERDAQTVIESLRRGRVYSSVDALAPQPAFAFTATSGPYRAVMGDLLPIGGPVAIDVQVQAPPDARISLRRDGVEVRSAQGSRLRHEADAAPAVFRVEVTIPGAPGRPAVPWIVSNPIYVGRSDAVPAPAPAAPAATASVNLYRDGPVPDWRLERSPTAEAALDAMSAVGGSQLMFRYALSGTASSSPYAALAIPIDGGLDGYARVAFRVRADRPTRFSVQLRAPRDTGSAARWWRSIYADENERDAAVAFDDMMALDNAVPARPRLADVRSLLFVVDTVNTAPGSAGRLFFDEIRLERVETAGDQVRTVSNR